MSLSRYFRFRLRTLLKVLVPLCVVLALVGYQRRAAEHRRQKLDAEWNRLLERDRLMFPSAPAPPPQQHGARTPPAGDAD